MTAELSTEIDEQKEEMEQLKKEKNEILDDMEAHKLAVSKLCIVNYMHLRVHAAVLSFVESLSSLRVCIYTSVLFCPLSECPLFTIFTE